MSQDLLDTFLREVQIAHGDIASKSPLHVNFKESSSSLAGLFAELRRQVGQGKCQVMTLQEALELCDKPNDPRLGKYIPALTRLCSSWGADAGAKHIYLPGLARGDFIEDTRSVNEKVTTAFSIDGYITDVVKYWMQRRAEVIDCGRPLRWVLVSAPPRTSAARVVTRPGLLLGRPDDNILARKAGAAPKAPGFNYRKPLEDDSFCIVARRLAQPMPSNPPARLRVGWSARLRAGWKANLERVAADHTLYIIGHCSETGTSLSYHMATAARCAVASCDKKHAELYSVDAVTLASLLVDEGLTANLERIEVVGCYTGGLEVDAVQTVQPFAQRLAGALSGFGFASVKVAGAKGITSRSTVKVAGRHKLYVQGKMTREAGGYFVEDGDADYSESRRWFPAISQ
jgi:hypothetical protein